MFDGFHKPEILEANNECIIGLSCWDQDDNEEAYSSLHVNFFSITRLS